VNSNYMTAGYRLRSDRLCSVDPTVPNVWWRDV